MTAEAAHGEGSIVNTAVSDARGLLQGRRDVRDIYWQEGLHIKVVKATQEVQREIRQLLSTKLQSVTLKFDSIIPVDDIADMISALPDATETTLNETAEMSTVGTVEMNVVNPDSKPA